MQTRRNILAAIAVVPLALAVPAVAAPAWDAQDWMNRWAAGGGTILLLDGKLSFSFRPEDHEQANRLFREFKAHPGAEDKVKGIMSDLGLIYFHN